MRPIAVGCTLRHLAAKCVRNRVMQAMGALLTPHQLGYGVPLGTEAAVHATRVFLQNLHPGHLILKLDFRNAFNCLRRNEMIKAVGKPVPELLPLVLSAYGSPGSLFFGKNIILSSEGVQVLQGLSIVQRAARELGLQLNCKKSEMVCEVTTTRKVMLHAVPGICKVNRHQATILGSSISNDISIQSAIQAKSKSLEILGNKLQDSHDAFCHTLAIPKVLHMLRTSLTQILPLCYLHLVAASRSYTCTQDGLDTVQLALVVFFLPPASANTPLAVMVVITCCNLRWWCFSLEH